MTTIPTFVLDDWLHDFPAVREWADAASYTGVTNPADGVIYPGVCSDIPPELEAEVLGKLEQAVGRVTKHLLFTRLSLAGVPVPHQAHTDAIMGEWSLMLYLNRAEDCPGNGAGTSLVRHNATGMYSHPNTPGMVKRWMSDTNKPERWSIWYLAEMRANRAFIFPADLFHRAEPVGGFGDTPQNGRLVLTTFFDVEKS